MYRRARPSSRCHTSSTHHPRQRGPHDVRIRHSTRGVLAGDVAFGLDVAKDMTMQTPPRDIRLDRPDPQIMRVTLAREKQRNAYTMRMCRELLAALEQFDRDDSARALILTGAGAGFCAGGDVSGGDDEH